MNSYTQFEIEYSNQIFKVESALVRLERAVLKRKEIALKYKATIERTFLVLENIR